MEPEDDKRVQALEKEARGRSRLYLMLERGRKGRKMTWEEKK